MGNKSLPPAARYLVWFVMTNHVHLIVKPNKTSNASKAIGETHRGDTRE